MGEATTSLLRDPDRERRILDALAQHLGSERFSRLQSHLAVRLSENADPDMALNNLERYLSAAPHAVEALLDEQGAGLESLLQLLGASQFFGDVLAADPAAFEQLRVPLRQSPSIDEMRDQLQKEIDSAAEDAGILRGIRRFRQRQMLRIGANDIIRDRPLEEITRDLSNVADAILEVALATAMRTMANRFGQPFGGNGAPARCTLFAFGKLGGQELNYSSDIDLMLVFDAEGGTRGRGAGIGNDEFYGHVVTELVRLISAHSDRGQAYRIDLRLRPEGRRGPLARSLSSTLSYYDAMGRTWERQALIKVRPVAGDAELGREFLANIESFVYRKYLSFAEINEIKAIKRRIERKARASGFGDTDVKTGHGGIRDIEFTIQFLQLLNGGDLPAVRQRNTLAAMQSLESTGCLTLQEYQILADAYRFLRKTEHRLQLLFDLQTHRLPTQPGELRKLAQRSGYLPGNRERGEPRRTPRPRSPLDDSPPEALDTRDLLIDPLDAFLHDYHEKTRLNRQILDHLLHAAFAEERDQAEPETDLLLAPDPDDATIAGVLGRYPFRDIAGAYRNLTLLAQESVPFLSTRRCRHFLASIAPSLLRAIASTPDPDLTLRNLEKVAASLGAKAVLWELLSVSPPSLKLVVELCSGSQFLTEILIQNPGMIDDLLDSLLLNRPRSISELQTELAELCRGAADTTLILRSFQDKELLRIGVQDLLGKTSIRETTRALSDLAETILAQVCTMQSAALRQRFGTPTLPNGAECRFAMLGLGKLGGRELGYHSDLDVVLVYEDDGSTVPSDRQATAIDNVHYFSELGTRVIKILGASGPTGKLYQVDMRLRPTGRSASLATPLATFQRYYQSAAAQLWERQALTRARPVAGDAVFGQQLLSAAHEAAFGPPWRPELADEIRAMRERLESSRGERDLKRGFGGIVDIEFLVQLLQLKFGGETKSIRATNTWDALGELHRARLLSDDDYRNLEQSYGFLRLVESRLRIMTNRALDAVPEEPEDLEKLARRLGYDEQGEKPARDAFVADLERYTQRTRECFLRIVERERGPSALSANSE